MKVFNSLSLKTLNSVILSSLSLLSAFFLLVLMQKKNLAVSDDFALRERKSSKYNLIYFRISPKLCNFAAVMKVANYIIRMWKHVALVAVCLCMVVAAHAQGDIDHPGHVNPEDMQVDMDNPTFVPMVKVGKVLMGRDSIQYVELNNVWVFTQPVFKNAQERAAFNRLVYNVKKVLPIAKEVNRIIIETGDYLETLPNKKAKDEHMKRVEAAIRKEYTPRMKKLTYSQGKLLIKLVYRECNSSSYDLIKAFLGPVRAGFWQAFAWVFGASLKKDYEPKGVDRLTERVVLLVEAGQL